MLPPDAPVTAPVPVLGEFNLSTGILVVTFDQALVPTPGLDTMNWTARIDGDKRAITAAEATGSQVVALTAPTLPEAGPDVCSFAPPPFDVIGQVGGLPAAAFTDFPVVAT